MTALASIKNTLIVNEVAERNRTNFIRSHFASPSLTMHFEAVYCHLARKGMIPSFSGGTLDFIEVETEHGTLPVIIPASFLGEGIIANIMFGQEESFPRIIAGIITTALTLVCILDCKEQLRISITDDQHSALCDMYYALMDAGRCLADQQGLSREFFNFTD